MLATMRKEGVLVSMSRVKELLRIEDLEGVDSREF